MEFTDAWRSREDLLQAIVGWARTRGVTTDPYVIGVARAIEEERDLSFWAMTTPTEMLPQPLSGPARRMARIARDIAIVRNVIIFVPVALTWYAVGQATTAFEKFIANNSTTTANFLEFWQNGYGLLADAWRIGNVAALDFYIIMGVIALSLLLGALNARALTRETLDGALFDDERLQLGLSISRYLQAHRDVSQQTLGADLAASTERLARATQDIAIVAERLESSTVGVAALAPQLATVCDQLQGLADSVMSGIETSAQDFTATVSATANDIRSSLISLVATVESLQHLITGDLTSSVNRSAAELDHLSDNLTATGSTVKRSMRSLEDQLDDLHRHLSIMLRKDE